MSDSPSTYHSHTHNEIGGRFGAINKLTVIGSTPTAQYPGTVPAWSADAGPQEPPLGFSVDAIEPVGEVFETEKSLGQSSSLASVSNAPEGEERTTLSLPHPSPSNADSTDERAAQAPAFHAAVERRRSPPFRRRV